MHRPVAFIEGVGNKYRILDGKPVKNTEAQTGMSQLYRDVLLSSAGRTLNFHTDFEVRYPRYSILIIAQPNDGHY